MSRRRAGRRPASRPCPSQAATRGSEAMLRAACAPHRRRARTSGFPCPRGSYMPIISLLGGKCRDRASAAPPPRRLYPEVPLLRGAELVLTHRLRALERRDGGAHQRFERLVARGYEARDAGAQRDVAAAVAGARVVDQQIAHTLDHHFRVLAGARRTLALREHDERAALPTPDEIAAA